MSTWSYDAAAVAAAGAACATACGRLDACNQDWTWQAVLSLMTFSSLFLSCSALW
jgi:hypothetical protein